MLKTWHLEFIDGLKERGGNGKESLHFPNIHQHAPLRNPFPFTNVNSSCQMLSSVCPKPKVGVSTLDFLVIGMKVLESLFFPSFHGPLLLVNEEPQLTVWAEIIIALGLLPSLTLSVQLSPGLSESQGQRWVKLCYIIAHNFVLHWMGLYFVVSTMCCQIVEIYVPALASSGKLFLIKNEYDAPEFSC